MDQWSVPKGTLLGLSFAGWRVERDSVLSFADHEPRANFAHTCSYFLHDVATGELVRRVPARFPPYPMEGLHLLELFYEPVRRPEFEVRRVPVPRPTGFQTRKHATTAECAPAGRRYAILFAGKVETWHANDIELYRRMLILNFGFAPEDVYTLFNDGTATGGAYRDEFGNLRQYPGPVASPPFPGAPDPDNLYSAQFPKPRYKGSRATFIAVLNYLRPRLKANDLLFILTEGHGENLYGQETVEQCLVAIADGPYPELYRSSEMKADLQTLAGANYDALLVVMNQCFSGGFSDAVLTGSTAQRTFFAHATGADAVAYTDELYRWNLFSRHWMEAEIRQCLDPQDYMPTLDDDGDGKIDAFEALRFCQLVDQVEKPDGEYWPPPTSAKGDGTSPAENITLL
jgi:hypothetical protein